MKTCERCRYPDCAETIKHIHTAAGWVELSKPQVLCTLCIAEIKSSVAAAVKDRGPKS